MAADLGCTLGPCAARVSKKKKIGNPLAVKAKGGQGNSSAELAEKKKGAC